MQQPRAWGDEYFEAGENLLRHMHRLPDRNGYVAAAFEQTATRATLIHSRNGSLSEQCHETR